MFKQEKGNQLFRSYNEIIQRIKEVCTASLFLENLKFVLPLAAKVRKCRCNSLSQNCYANFSLAFRLRLFERMTNICKNKIVLDVA